MVSDYHKTVEDGITLLGRSLKRAGKVWRIYKGNKRPLSIVAPTLQVVLKYKPDVYFILRNNKKLIFEILDSEGKKQDIIVADIIRSFLVENVEALAFVHPDSATIQNTVLVALKTIYRGMVDKGVHPKDLPNPEKTGPYAVSKSEAKTAEAVKAKLEKKSIC